MNVHLLHKCFIKVVDLVKPTKQIIEMKTASQANVVLHQSGTTTKYTLVGLGGMTIVGVIDHSLSGQ